MNLRQRLAAFSMLATIAGLTPMAQAAEYKVAILHAQTGALAFVGVPVSQGIRLAAEQLNASHYFGNDTISLITADYASDKAQAITLISRLAKQDDAIAILGPTGSIEGAALAPVANDLKVPMLTTAVTTEVLKAGPWSFKATTSAEGLMSALAQYAVDKTHCKKVVTVFNRDNDGHINNARVFRDYLRDHGATIAGEEGTLVSDSDFSALGTKVAFLAPDCLFITANAAQAANVVVQLRQAGMPETTKVFGVAAMATEQYMTAGGEAVEGTFMATDYNPAGASKLNQDFVAAYKQRFNASADNWAAVGYTTMMLTALAIHNAGPNPDREKVRAALTAIKDVPVVLGNGTFNLDATRLPVYGASVLTAHKGKIETAP